ncbi:Nif3-like dinuclear metal center hexameric protein [Marinilabiliaceae bacterium ANBcel2]|nr:Nif3-like dinuclear metal center hexameric protein [Marinilabiliaceae bacterium ANBcel2]
MSNPTVEECIKAIEHFAPVSLQESFDNSGLQTGDPKMEVNGALLTIDVTSSIVEEAIKKGCNLIVSHHPILLTGIKQITPCNETGNIILNAIKNNIAIYSAHTNIDNVKQGVSGILADKLGVINQKVLHPKGNSLVKLAVFVPHDNAEKLRAALFEAGAGHIGNYDNCSYNSEGTGTFKGNENSNPYKGEKERIHFEPELKIEVILQKYKIKEVVNALIAAHPYEEPAYDIIALENSWNEKGLGITGELENEIEWNQFLSRIKEITKTGVIKHTNPIKEKIKKVAICGGSGSSFLSSAIAKSADIYISGDFKYHQFFEAENRIMIADIGHYESEQFTKELFFEILTKKFPNFAVRLSEINSNPIKYF